MFNVVLMICYEKGFDNTALRHYIYSLLEYMRVVLWMYFRRWLYLGV